MLTTLYSCNFTGYPAGPLPLGGADWVGDGTAAYTGSAIELKSVSTYPVNNVLGAGTGSSFQFPDGSWAGVYTLSVDCCVDDASYGAVDYTIGGWSLGFHIHCDAPSEDFPKGFYVASTSQGGSCASDPGGYVTLTVTVDTTDETYTASYGGTQLAGGAIPASYAPYVDAVCPFQGVGFVSWPGADNWTGPFCADFTNVNLTGPSSPPPPPPPPTPAKLDFDQDPYTTVMNTTITPAVTVDVLDSAGALVTTDNSSVTVALGINPDGATLSGTLTEPAVHGVATFDDLSIDTPDVGYTLTATDGNLTPATSYPFDITGQCTLTWTGAAGDQIWSDPANWDKGIAPVNGDSLVFPGGAPLTTTNDLVGLTVANIDIQGSGYQLGGNDITLIGSLTSEADNNAFNINATLVGSVPIDSVTGTLTINGILGGTGAPTLEGAGDVTFSGNDTYTGTTVVEPGVTVVDSGSQADAFGSGTIEIAAGPTPATLDFTGSGSETLADNILFDPNAGVDIDPSFLTLNKMTINGSNVISGQNLGDSVTLNSLYGSGSLETQGSGTFIIAGSVGSGITSVNVTAGTLVLGQGANGFDSTSINVQSGGTLTTDQTQDSSGNYVATGATGWSGTINLMGTGVIQDYDTKDGNGLGDGTLALDGGKLVAKGGGSILVGNPLTLAGNTTIDDNGPSPRFSFSSGGGPISVNANSELTLGSGGITLPPFVDSIGDGTTIWTGTAGNDLLTIAGSDPVAIKGTIHIPMVFETTSDGVLFSDSLYGSLADGVTVTVRADSSSGQTAVQPVQLSLASSSGGAITVDKGGTVQLMASDAGSSDIEVQDGGTLTTDPSGAGAPNYTGTITLDPGGTIQYQDTQDGNGLGTGPIDFEGGTVNCTGGPGMWNPLTLEGDITFNLPPGQFVVGNPKATSTITVAENSTLTLEQSGSPSVGDNLVISPQATVAGAGALTFAGNMPVTLDGTTKAPLVFNTTNSRASVGSSDLEGEIDASVTLASDVEVYMNGPGDASSGIRGISGNGGIDVQNGATLVSWATYTPTGSPTYNGTVTLEIGGTIDVSHGNLGTGTLALNGGTLKQNSSTTSTLYNPTVDMWGSVTISGATTATQETRLKFAGMVYMEASGPSPGCITVDATGTLALFGGIGNLIGAQNVLTVYGRLYVQGGNPEFDAACLLATGGKITVDTNTGLGTGAMTVFVPAGSNSGSATLLAASVGDPILDNPITVENGSLQMDGQFTLTGGVTVDSGATFDIEGSGTQVTPSSVTGSGIILLGGGNLTIPAAGDTFTGAFQFAGGTATRDGKPVPTISVVDLGGTFNASPQPAAATVAGSNGVAGSSLEGVGLTLTYYTGSGISGSGSSTAPSAVGTYTVVAAFAGSTDYAVAAGATTFNITPLATETDTPGLYAPSGSGFLLRNSDTAGCADCTFAYGPAGSNWVPLAGDWTGSGTTTVGLFNPVTSVFYLRNANACGSADATFQFGPAGQTTAWIPLAGDWTGDGKTTIGLYNPTTSVFFLHNSNAGGAADMTFQFGPVGCGWVPLAGDWAGSGKTTVGLFDPLTSIFYLRDSNTPGPADTTFKFGPSEAEQAGPRKPGIGMGNIQANPWIPLAGDWDADGQTTVGLYDPATAMLYLRCQNACGGADMSFAYGASGAGLIPIVGDWGGRADVSHSAALAVSASPSLAVPSVALEPTFAATASAGGVAGAALPSTTASSSGAVSATVVQPAAQTTAPYVAALSPLAVDCIDLSAVAEDAAQSPVDADSLDALAESIAGGTLTV
jgi:autotransporter-associated beta strand protein